MRKFIQIPRQFPLTNWNNNPYNILVARKEAQKMAFFGGAGGAGVGGAGWGAGIAIVVVIILLLIALGIVF